MLRGYVLRGSMLRGSMLLGSMLLRVDYLVSWWSRLRGSMLRGSVLHGSMLRGSMLLRVDSVGVAWLTGDSKSKSGRSLDGTPVGVRGVLGAGASKRRGAVRCAGSHLSRNCVSPTCISSMRRSCIPSKTVPHDTVHV